MCVKIIFKKFIVFLLIKYLLVSATSILRLEHVGLWTSVLNWTGLDSSALCQHIKDQFWIGVFWTLPFCIQKDVLKRYKSKVEN